MNIYMAYVMSRMSVHNPTNRVASLNYGFYIICLPCSFAKRRLVRLLMSNINLFLFNFFFILQY